MGKGYRRNAELGAGKGRYLVRLLFVGSVSRVCVGVLLPFMGKGPAARLILWPWVRWGLLAPVTGWNPWVVVLNNYERGVVINHYPVTPLFIPKIVVALGFAFLGFTALQMMFTMLAERFLHFWHDQMDGVEIERYNLSVDDVLSDA